MSSEALRNTPNPPGTRSVWSWSVTYGAAHGPHVLPWLPTGWSSHAAATTITCLPCPLTPSGPSDPTDAAMNFFFLMIPNKTQIPTAYLLRPPVCAASFMKTPSGPSWEEELGQVCYRNTLGISGTY